MCPKYTFPHENYYIILLFLSRRTASAPITNHKFTVDNIVYDNGALGDPEKPTISGPLELEQTNGNTPQPSSSNGIEAH